MKKILCCMSLLAAVLFAFPNYTNAQQCASSSEAQKNSAVVESAKPIDLFDGNYDKKIQVVFSDIDSTLLVSKDAGQKSVSTERLRQTIQKLKQNNIPLVLVTGRSYSDVKELAADMGVDNAYVVALKGSVIVNPKGEVIYKADINHEDSVKIIEDFYKYPRKNHKTSGVYFFVNDKESGTKDFILPYKGVNVIVGKNLDEFGKDFKASKIDMYNEDIQELITFQKYIKKKYPNYSVDRSAPRYCDVTSLDAGKGNAVVRVSKILGIPLQNAVVFGDAENDLTMFKAVRSGGGLTIAVGNALDILKQNADYVTLPVSDDGVCYAIDKIIQNNALLNKKAQKVKCKNK